MKFTRSLCLVSLCLTLPTLLSAKTKRIPIDEVPAGFPVGFSLLTSGNRQHVAYYNADHQMTVASRDLDSETWTRTHLPSKIGWDSHNYLTMVEDDDGQLHLSGNMHCVPLIYFRTTRPGDTTSFQQIKTMVGPEELRCTYPNFMRGPDNELIFHYRTGGSGKGNEIYNVYDHKTRTWSRLLDKPLTDGLGMMNAYMHGPTKGPDGFFHLVWVWRDTPDCATNHDLSYARSRDLRSWETIAGEALTLPLSFAEKRLIVDPIPPGGGIINGCAKIGFDSKNHPIITYHKYDAKGFTQAFAARFESGRWVSRQISDWSYRWEFNGGGSIDFDVGLSTPQSIGHGRMSLSYSHIKHGRGSLVFDGTTLAPIDDAEDPHSRLPGPPRDATPRLSASLGEPSSNFPGMTVKWANDTGEATTGILHRLRWETLPRYRDRRRPGEHPESSRLELIEVTGPTP